VIADELIPVAAAVAAALRAAGLTLTAYEVDVIQRTLAEHLWPLLDEPSRRLVTNEGIQLQLDAGRAVLVRDADGTVHLWNGES
jgi:hypothetical protein